MSNKMTREMIEEKLNQYRFYHIIELDEGLFTPGLQEVLQLQQYVSKALKSIPLQDKRILDIGCRDGVFCFDAERMGAEEVIGIDNDLSIAATEFLIPYFNSKVKMFELNVYDLTPEKFGIFDIVVFSGVLYHLRYPFWALKRISDVVKDRGQIIIETALLDSWDKHAILFCPIGSESPFEPTSITFFNTKGLVDTLYSLGITVRSIDYLGERAKQKLEFAFEPESEVWLKMPINRAVFICDRTLDISDPNLIKYWDHTHAYHTTGLLPYTSTRSSATR